MFAPVRSQKQGCQAPHEARSTHRAPVSAEVGASHPSLTSTFRTREQTRAAADTFVVRNGKIVMQTFAASK